MLQTKSPSQVLTDKDLQAVTNLLQMGDDAWLDTQQQAALSPDGWELLGHYKRSFTQAVAALRAPSDAPRIPKIIHLVWLGQFPFPSEERLKAACQLHPDWTVNVWMDIARPLHVAHAEVRLLDELPGLVQSEAYRTAKNYAERSDLCRLAVLEDFGGVYIDHDVTLLKPLDPWVHAVDFFCPAEQPDRSYSQVNAEGLHVTNCIFGAKPQHPIIKEAVQICHRKSAEVERHWIHQNLRNSGQALCLQTLYRGYTPLTDAAREPFLGQDDNLDVVTPPDLFARYDGTPGIFAQHSRKGSWVPVRGVNDLIKYQRRTQTLIGILGGVMLFQMALMALFFFLR